MTRPWAALTVLTLAGPLNADPSAVPARADDRPDFFDALGLARRPDPAADIWKLAETSPQQAWMTDRGPFPTGAGAFRTEPFQQILDRMADADDRPRPPGTAPGLILDAGRWRYKHEMTGDLYRRTTKLEVPDPQDPWVPYRARTWTAYEKVHVPVPIAVPTAEQLFVYGQFEGSGDALTPHQTSLFGKSGVGVKWALIAGSELQLRYATLLNYADAGPSRVLPSVEVLAKLPLVGPLQLEYTGAAIPAVARTDTDQFKQELRLAYPLTGDNELEFGARYRWDLTPTTPWVDRAQLFLGVKLRH